MTRLLLVAFGGALGSAARYLLTMAVGRLLGGGFPMGTLAVNVIGSFLVAVILQLGLQSGTMTMETRLFLSTGLMGGFTTYSAFNYETLQLLQQGSWLLGAMNVGLTVVTCLGAGALGLLLGRIFTA